METGRTKSSNKNGQDFESHIVEKSSLQQSVRIQLNFISQFQTQISRLEEQEDGPRNKFMLGEEIFARAYWPRALNNYPLGKVPNGKGGFAPVYGPEFILRSEKQFQRHNCNFTLYLSINGQRYSAKDKSYWWKFVNDSPIVDSNILIHQEKYENSPEWQEDIKANFYSYNQTMWWAIYSPQYNDLDLRPASIRFAHTLLSLPPGDHHFQFELCFQIVPTIHNEGYFPPIPTPLSTPISVGEFYISIPDEESKREFASKFSVFPPRGKISIPDNVANRLEDKILHLLEESPQWGSRRKATEHCIHVALQSEWHPISTLEENSLPNLLKPPTRFGIDFSAVFVRKKETGWEKNMCVVFSLSAVKIGQNDEEPEIGDIFVGGNTEIEIEVLPEEIKKKFDL